MTDIYNFSILIEGNNDLILERTLQSIAQQTLPNIQVIFLDTENKESRDALAGRFEHLRVEFLDVSLDSFSDVFEFVKASYALCLSTNERLLTSSALDEYFSTFQKSAESTIVLSNTRVTNQIGESLYTSKLAPRGFSTPSDLLTSVIIKSGGRGVAFRVPVLEHPSSETLIEALMALSQEGRITHLDNTLSTFNESNSPAPIKLQRLFKKILRSYFYPKPGRDMLRAVSYYHNLMTQQYNTYLPGRLWHSVLARLFYPFPYIKRKIQTGLQQLFSYLCLFLGFFGNIFFNVSNLLNRGVRNNSKFAFISHVLPPSPSGQSVVIERLLREVNPEEYILINSRQQNNIQHSISSLPVNTFELHENFPVEKLYKFLPLYLLANIGKALFRGWEIARICRGAGCGVLVSCTGDLINLPAAYFASMFCNVRYFAYYFDDYRFQWVDRKRRLFASLTEAFLLKRIDAVIVPNEFMQKTLVERQFVKTLIVRNPAEDLTEIRIAKKNIPPHKIIYTGSVYHVNIEAIKNVQIALELLDRQDIEFHIYTSQPEDLLQQYGLIGEYVQYHAHVLPEEIIEIQKDAFLLLVPFSFHSPVPEVIKTSAPGKIGDYLASGTAILAHVPGDSFVSWYIKKNECGIVVSENDPGQIARQIAHLLESPETYRRMVQNACQAAERDYSRKEAQHCFCGLVQDKEDCVGVLHVSATDFGGQQFNGYLLGERLRKKNLNNYMSVAYMQSDSPYVYEFGNGAYGNLLNRVLRLVLNKLAIQSLHPAYRVGSFFPKRMFESDIDIVHLQLIHAAPFFNLKLIPALSKNKTVVFTIHDQWAYTGHCVHPLECDGWLNGCQNCPDLARNIPMQRDSAAFMYRQKQRIFANSNIHLVVASEWMHERVKQSPIMGHLPCTVIPFGVDTAVFYPENKVSSRRDLNIPKGHKVIAFRATIGNVFKGIEYIKEALNNMSGDNITVLTMDKQGVFDEFKHKFNVVDLGWVSNQALQRKFFSVADIFLSPSVAESFGIMPLEAMSCGVPVIVFKKTVLEGLTRAPEIGTAVRYKDGLALGQAIVQLLDDSEELSARGKEGIQLIKSEYSVEGYVKKHIRLYQSLILKK